MSGQPILPKWSNERERKENNFKSLKHKLTNRSHRGTRSAGWQGPGGKIGPPSPTRSQTPLPGPHDDGQRCVALRGPHGFPSARGVSPSTYDPLFFPILISLSLSNPSPLSCHLFPVWETICPPTSIFSFVRTSRHMFAQPDTISQPPLQVQPCDQAPTDGKSAKVEHAATWMLLLPSAAWSWTRQRPIPSNIVGDAEGRLPTTSHM